MIDTKPYVATLEGKPAAVLGLGLSGRAAAKALMAGGAKVLAWDDGEETRAAAERDGIPLHDFTGEDFSTLGALVMSPGIPLYFPTPHLAADKARAAGIEILGDVDIFYRCNPGAKIVGITGTNGKSTTTALVTHILKEAGKNAIMAGNIGVPVLSIEPGADIVVLEISSYQMDLSPAFRPDIAVLLNITPDHINRHGSFESYVAAKERIFQGGGVAVCGIDDAPSSAIYDRLVKAAQRKPVPVSVKKEVAGGVYAQGGVLFSAMDGVAVEVGSLSGLTTLPGSHNHQDICAVFAVCRSLDIPAADIYAHLKTYPGLAHRQHLVRLINGIAYVNDSKATNAEAAARAIACYNNVYLIAGGQAKEGGLNGIDHVMDRIRHVFLIGEAMEDFSKWLAALKIPHTKSGSLDIAVLDAHKMAQEGRGQPGGAETVLLSPACASWDQFRNFEHRGDTFEALVKTLPDEAPL